MGNGKVYVMKPNPADDPTSIGSILIHLGTVTKDELKEALNSRAEQDPDQLLGMTMVLRKMITLEQLEGALEMQKDLRSKRKDKQALAQAAIAKAATVKCIDTAGRIRERVRLRFGNGSR